jgi:type I restriction enzyme S subunit
VSELMKGWVEVPIGSLCILNNGRAFKPTDWTTEGIPIVRIQNLNNPDAPFNHFLGEFNDRYHLTGGELLFAWSGTPGTSFGAHVWRGGEAVLNQHIFRVDFDEELLDKRFFRHAINQKLDELIGIAHGGVGLRHVTKGKFERTLVALPPLPEQKRIADKLDAVLARVDACRERLDRVPGILKRFRQAVLAAATSGGLESETSVDSDSVVISNRKSRLSDTLTQLMTGPFGSALHKADYVMGGIPVVNPMHINSGVIVPTTGMAVSTRKAEELSDFQLRVGDVIIARRGVMGRCAVVQPEQEGWLCGTGSMVLRPNTQLTPDYLQKFLSAPATIQVLESDAVGSTMVNLNQRILLSLEIWLPNLEEQGKIVRRVESLFAYADHLESRYTAARARIDRLTPSLLAKAFRGELVPQDPNDEPASQLLERISATRSAPGATKSPKKQRRPNQTAPTPPNSPKSEPTDVSEAQISIFVPEQNQTNGGAIPEENLLAALRTSVRGERSGLTESELLRGAASRLGFERLGKNIRTVLEHTLPTALHRRVVVLEDDRYVAATPTIARYDDDFLMESLSAIMRSDYEYKPDDIAEMMAGYLGYSAVTEAMRERIDGVVAEGLRVGVLQGKGGWVWREK